MRLLTKCLLAASLALSQAGCSTPEPFDYRPLVENMPVSILVLPAINESVEVDASSLWLSTITVPLAEQGYYVFPVALVERIMLENGLPTPWEMHTVSLNKIREVFGADAVLYVTIEDWGTSYQLIDSSTTVSVRARLVDVGSGAEIWSGEATAMQRSSDGGGGLVGAMVGAVVNQVMTSINDPSRAVSRLANTRLFEDGHAPLLPGGYHPDHQRRVDEARVQWSTPAP